MFAGRQCLKEISILKNLYRVQKWLVPVLPQLQPINLKDIHWSNFKAGHQENNAEDVALFFSSFGLLKFTETK
jgi:hypothetical protein